MSNYATGDEIEVRIEKIVPRGFGIGFAENLTVLVPLAAPGDVVRVRIRNVKKRLAFADIVEVKEAGPERVSPHCQYFGICGGCDFQQLSYAAQLDAKVAIIRDCLHRIGKIEYDAEIPISAGPQQYGYRSRARWQVDRDKQAIGYFRRDSHDVIDVAECPILTPDLESKLRSIRENMDWNSLSNERSEIHAAAGEDAAVSAFAEEMIEPTSELTFAAYSYAAETFFQANKFLISELVEAALRDAEGDAAFDLYSGVGLFTVPMAKRFAKVVAVEENATSVRFAKKNIENAGLDNVRLVASSVGRFLAENQKKRLDLILIDPPRSGTERMVIPTLAKLKPAMISYVSCEPSILARDLRTLLDAGYRIDRIIALDLFPQTHHVETVVRLRAV